MMLYRAKRLCLDGQSLHVEHFCAAMMLYRAKRPCLDGQSLDD